MVSEELVKIAARDESILVLDDGMDSPDAIKCCFGIYTFFIS